jgi:hypothetical protein
MRPMTDQTSSAAPGERTDPHASDAMTGPHGSAADHGEDHGHDDHAHAGEAVGPIDTRAWGAGLLGVILGLVVVVAIAIAAGSIH